MGPRRPRTGMRGVLALLSGAGARCTTNCSSSFGGASRDEFREPVMSGPLVDFSYAAAEAGYCQYTMYPSAQASSGNLDLVAGESPGNQRSK